MSSSKFRDKQITELSKSHTRSSLDDDEEEEQEGDDQDQSFDFYPFRSLQSPSRPLHGTHLRGLSSMDCIESKRFFGEKAGILNEVALISEIDRKMKKHVDVLLHSVECLSARVSQLESRTRQLENGIDDLKESIEFHHGRTNGKLRELGNTLTEVQSVIQDLRDKQEIAEAQLRLAKLQVSKNETKKEKQNSTVQASLGKEALPLVSQQSHQSVPFSCPQQFLTLSPNVTNLPLPSHPPTPPAAAAPQLPTQLLQNTIPSIPQQESYHPLPVLTPETTHQQYHVPPTQQSQPSAHQAYQPPPHLPLNLQLPQLLLTMSNPQVHSLSHHPEQFPHMPSHSIHKSSETPGRSPPPQKFNVGSFQQMHNQPLNRHYSESTSANTQTQGLQSHGPANVIDCYHYGASPTHSGSSNIKPLQPLSTPPVPGSENSCSQLPTAQILPHAIPTASGVDDGSSSGGNGNRLPVDDVVDKVVAMGFRRDLVRATVKKLTENGQLADLNVVLDKLMNNG